MTKENLLTFDQVKQQLHGEPEAIIIAMTVTGRKTQEEIDHAKAFWKTLAGYQQIMELIYFCNGDYFPGQLTQDYAD